MARTALKRIRSLSPTLSRGFWLIMLLLHAPALIGVWKSFVGSDFVGEELGGCVALSIAMLFFALKFRGVACLEFRTGKHSWVAIGMAVALIHVDCMRPELDGSVLSQGTVILTTTTLVGGLTQVPRTFRAALARSGSVSKPHTATGRSTATVWLNLDQLRCWVFARHLFTLRAPPA